MAEPQDRISTGVPGLDRVLRGGYPDGRIMLIEGAPGTGKTTLALHFLVAGAAAGKRALFVSVAQSRPELEMIASSHGLDISGIEVFTPELGAGERTFSVESDEADLVKLMEGVGEVLETSEADIFVFDSLLELRMLASADSVYRRELLMLRRQLRERGCTSMLIDHLEQAEGQRNAEGVVHGVIKLDAVTPPIGVTQRRLTVVKLRGAPFKEGWHDFRIATGGIEVFPRVIPEEAEPADLEERLEPPHEPLARLLGGGLEFGTTTLVSGQSGSGKSTIATLLARAAADRGVPAAMFLFEERPEVLRNRSRGVGLDIVPQEEAGRLNLHHFDPAEVSPGEFANAVLGAVDEGARLVVIDSLSGYFEALPDRRHVMTHMQALLQHLTRREVLVIITLSQHGLLGEPPTTSIDTSFLADSIILLRQYESRAEIRRSIAVLKKRHSEHERNIEQLIIRTGGVEIIPLSEEAEERARYASELSAE
ncbi:ATPase domain-containing protein [Roseivivax sediminis]|uniref:non-specific serine/threonine protein kinase n=1 Tax=Roseivivax sediminis TaxID=936889 RepID=A0A1I2A9Y8_9RHOB|nr:ATPase domain-containing protein [Roseivivax sediminis]SFE40579.1 circadian clock protein KaiC [Roseivivax sediminis]